MSSTTANRRMPLFRVLLISIAVQATGVLVFYSVAPLRRSVLTPEQRDVEKLSREAKERLRDVEKERAEQREHIELKREDAQALAREHEKREAGEIRELLADMKQIRDELEDLERENLADLAQRSLRDVSLDLFYRLHPLATQLVENARAQAHDMPLAAAPDTVKAAEALLRYATREQAALLEPEVFDALNRIHRALRSAQHTFIQQLDASQAGYPDNIDRIRRENHTEYLVNLKRDEIGRLLQSTHALDPATMNDPPAGYAAPAELPGDWSESIEKESVAELHQTAQEIFNEIAQFYSGARAAEMALARHTTMAEAMNTIALPGPPSSFDGGSLSGPPGTVGELNRYAAALGRATRDVRHMRDAARNMGGDRTADRGAAGAPGQGGRSASRAGVGVAAQGNGGRFADMTGFMYVGGRGERGFASGNAGGRDITRDSVRSGYLETGAGTPGAKPPLLAEEKVIAQALPGRKFRRDSARTGWLYIDTWYVIGPWENNSRTSFEKAHPPETLVDLDAEYEGKNGMPLRWAFHQSDSIRVKPPNEMESATYYGYTEVYFEEETEMLVAVASDDAARVWLNDLLIWEDSGLGPWRLDEGFRRVVFRKGFNTVLLRIENGPVTCTFSLMLCPPEVLAAR